MNRIMKFFTKNAVLIVILLLALVIRFVSSTPGYPPYHSDEGISYSAASSMIKNNNLDPLRYDYPSVVPLVNYIFYKGLFIPVYWSIYYLVSMGDIVSGNLEIPLSQTSYDRILQESILGLRELNALAWSRYITSLVGVGVVFLVYLVGKKLFGSIAGIIAAFLVAVNYRAVLNSTLGLPDTYNSFFLLLSFYATLLLWEKPTLKRYLLAGGAIALSLSTKYQVFAFFPFLLVHSYLSFGQRGWEQRIRYFLSPKLFISLGLVILLFLLLNPYLIIHFEQAKEIISFVAVKYAAGKNSIELFGLVYLYRIGISEILTIFACIGVILGLLFDWKKVLLILSILFPFVFVTNYYTIGGFYVRNYITIIPFILMFAAFVLFNIYKLLEKFQKIKILNILVLVLLVLFVTKPQLDNVLILASNYNRSWNVDVLNKQIKRIVPEGVFVASNQPIPKVDDEHRLPYALNKAYSISEFKDAGAQFAVGTFDWMTTHFYWWMNVGGSNGFKFFNKPVYILEETYPALAARELEDYSIFHVIKPWQAPESNFIVAVIPKYSQDDANLKIAYSFIQDTQEWNKGGKLWYPNDNLKWVDNGYLDDGALLIAKGGASSPILRWQSEPIDIRNWRGIMVDGYLKAAEGVSDMNKDGFLRVDFFRSKEDLLNNQNKIATRLSSRLDQSNVWLKRDVISIIPDDAVYMRLGFQVYDPVPTDVMLDNISVYEAKVTEDLSGFELEDLTVDQNVLFLNSQGGL